MSLFTERENPSTTVKVLKNHIPFILISAQALSKMYQYIQQCADEIGWLGTVRHTDANSYLIDDVYLFEQQVHATTTEIKPDDLAKMAEELLQREDGVDIWNNMKMWGHSHVNMGITPSSQDDKQMEEFGQAGHDFFIRLIGNKKGEMKLDFYNYATGVVYLDVPWIEETSEEIAELRRQLFLLEKAQKEAGKEEIKEEITKKVRKISYGTSTYTQSNFYSKYGRYVNGKWVQWTNEAEYQAHDAAEKAKKKPTNPPSSLTTTVTKTSRTGNKTTGGKTQASRGTFTDGTTVYYTKYDFHFAKHDMFQTQDDVVAEFGKDLLQIYSQYDFDGLVDALREDGYEGCVSFDDASNIWAVGFKIAMTAYQGRGGY